MSIVKKFDKIVAIIGVALVAGGIGMLLIGQIFPTQERKVVENTKKQNAEATVVYKGKDGKDALTLLQEKTTVEQNSTGLVIGINKRLADSKKREYWAFYVNGKMAPVGPAEYKTKETDTIEWKIEKY